MWTCSERSGPTVRYLGHFLKQDTSVSGLVYSLFRHEMSRIAVKAWSTSFRMSVYEMSSTVAIN